jgi:hypothetical protein
MNIDRMASLAANDARDRREELDRAILASAIDKVARKYERLAPWARQKDDGSVLMKLTTGELRVLKQFHSKFYDN